MRVVEKSPNRLVVTDFSFWHVIFIIVIFAVGFGANYTAIFSGTIVVSDIVMMIIVPLLIIILLCMPIRTATIDKKTGYLTIRKNFLFLFYSKKYRIDSLNGFEVVFRMKNIRIGGGGNRYYRLIATFKDGGRIIIGKSIVPGAGHDSYLSGHALSEFLNLPLTHKNNPVNLP